jgi:DNA-binding transcriptional LysR family regulator
VDAWLPVREMEITYWVIASPMIAGDAQIKRRELVRILPESASPEIYIHALYPTRRFVPTKLQVFLEELKAWKSPLWLPLD